MKKSEVEQDSSEVRGYFDSRYQIIKRKAEELAGKAQSAMFGECNFEDERYSDD